MHVRHQHNPKVSPFGSALTKKWQVKLGDVGTIETFAHPLSKPCSRPRKSADASLPISFLAQAYTGLVSVEIFKAHQP